MTNNKIKNSNSENDFRSILRFTVGGLAKAALISLNTLLNKRNLNFEDGKDLFLAHLDEYKKNQRRALLIAAENLLSGIEERLLPDGSKKLVLNAGMRNFREPWARDFGFASYGLLSLNELEATKQSLEVFLQFQKEDCWDLVSQRIKFPPGGTHEE